MSTTTFKGDIAELMAAAELAKRGYIVSRPLTNGAPYDLLVDTDEGIKRIQVKKANPFENGSLRVVLCSNKWHRGRTRISYHGRVDYLIAVDTDSGKYYIFGGDDLKSDELRIRLTPTMNNQKAGIRHACDYEIDRMLPHRVVVGAGFEPATPSV